MPLRTRADSSHVGFTLSVCIASRITDTAAGTGRTLAARRGCSANVGKATQLFACVDDVRLELAEKVTLECRIVTSRRCAVKQFVAHC